MGPEACGQSPQRYFLCLNESCNAEHHAAVVTNWAVEDAVVHVVLCAAQRDHAVASGERRNNHAHARTNYLKAAVQCAVEHSVVVDEAYASKVNYYTCWATVETHAVVRSCFVTTYDGTWHWLLNSRAMTWTTHFNTWPVAHCTATHFACHCRWCCQTCSHQDDCDAK